MILVLAGTRDGGELGSLLQEAGYQVLAAATTSYGASLARQRGLDRTLARPLPPGDLAQVITTYGITAVIDATHPYAASISQNCQRVCRELEIFYLRYERPSTPLPQDHPVHKVPSWTEGARKAARLGEVIFFAAGSKGLAPFLAEPSLKGRRVIARVLPAEGVVAHCLSLGLKPADIIALQGPFSKELNLALLSEYKAQVLVTKDGGPVGGTQAKFLAAKELGIPLVLLERPGGPYSRIAHNFERVLNILREEATL